MQAVDVLNNSLVSGFASMCQAVVPTTSGLYPELKNVTSVHDNGGPCLSSMDFVVQDSVGVLPCQFSSNVKVHASIL